ncbi:MAG: RNA polymerase sigma factor [Blautia sp.]|nr:RNA polymerase sigma factor [Blautia sp.]MCM1283355.1 RNA polymerase sigma factor [Roseburia sp.]MCM1430011.1 RNA polymerase sigma factor [Muribaculaceae bacterium]MCM1492962.1 RNA polymerase sigma factor [Muribaculaceae bacterium]
MEERLLVKRAKRGDVEAFGELYAQVYKKLYAYALYTLKRPADAEDAVSEAVADAFATIGQLKKEESFAGWMYRIVANKCNQRMREYYRQGGELTEDLMEAEGPPKDCWSDEREESLQVRQAFFQLPEEDRRIVGLHVFFGYRTREIAEALGMNENTVRSRESRALKRMSCQLLSS